MSREQRRSNLIDIHTSILFRSPGAHWPPWTPRQKVHQQPHERCRQPSTRHPRHLVRHPERPPQRHLQTTTHSHSHVTLRPVFLCPPRTRFRCRAALRSCMQVPSMREHPLCLSLSVPKCSRLVPPMREHLLLCCLLPTRRKLVPPMRESRPVDMQTSTVSTPASSKHCILRLLREYTSSDIQRYQSWAVPMVAQHSAGDWQRHPANAFHT